MLEPLWQLENVHLKGDRIARLAGVTLEIGPGTTAVMGPSGAGKTSLLNLLVGFERPDTGKLTAHLPQDADRLPLYWVPQDAGLWPHLTARQHLDQAAAHTPDRDQHIGGLLEAFDLNHRADAYPDVLSQGERSRLSVVRALAPGAAVVVMDEPLAHVDAARIGKYWQTVLDELSQTGSSLVFATHSPGPVLAYAQHVICLQDGRLLYEGAVEPLYRRPASAQLAACLGPANWLSPEECRLWLGETVAAPCCYRPEQIAVCPDGAGPMVVRDAVFEGSVAQATLEHQSTGKAKRFFHRPRSAPLNKGDRVLLKLCLLVLLLNVFCGCGGPEGDGPVLAVKATRTWPMPTDGTRIPAPRAATVDPLDNIIVLDTAGRVLVFAPDGTLIRQWRMPDSTNGNPEGVCVLKDGRIAIADTHYFRIVFFDDQGNVLSMLGSQGQDPGQFGYPVALTQDADENLYVCEYGANDRVQKFTADGKFILQFGELGTGKGQFQRPSGIVWHDGRIYVADAINNRIQVFSDDGRFISVLGSPSDRLGLHYPYDLTMDKRGKLYVPEYGSGRVTCLSPDGVVLGRWGRSGRGEGQLVTPWGIAVDSKMRLWVMDTGNRRIVELQL